MRSDETSVRHHRTSLNNRRCRRLTMYSGEADITADTGPSVAVETIRDTVLPERAEARVALQCAAVKKPQHRLGRLHGAMHVRRRGSGGWSGSELATPAQVAGSCGVVGWVLHREFRATTPPGMQRGGDV